MHDPRMASGVLDSQLRARPGRLDAGVSRLVMTLGLALLATSGALLILAAYRGFWLTDLQGQPAGRDFGGFWAAGREARRGQAALAYNWPTLARDLRDAGSTATARSAFPFFYPPVFLLVLAPLGALPFIVAAWVWIGGVYAAFVAMLGRITSRREWIVLGAAAPAAFCCLAVGQNGLLSAALVGASLAMLDRRPVLVGVFIGALVYKPQLGLLFPVALIVAGRWRTFASAATTAVGLTILSIAVFGWNAWGGFLHAAAGGGSGALAGAPDKLQSVYGLALALGSSGRQAWIVQLAATLAAVGFVAWLWRRPRPAGVQGAGLAACVLLATPYSFIYDAPLLVPAVLLLGSDGRRWSLAHNALLAFAYLAPLGFMMRACPVLPLACAGLCVVVAARARASFTEASAG